MNDLAQTDIMPAGVRIQRDGYSAEAGWFGPEDRPRFGWLYRPDTPAENGVGIVIVSPFGSEDMRAHRTIRHLAEDAARAGFVAVRFDLDGTGNSIGDDGDPDRIGAWQASIHDACDLARSAGAGQLVLVGVRLGATLATLAGPRRHDVAGLVAFNAVTTGKAYLRELRAFQLAMGLPAAPDAAASTGQETSGFQFTEETCSALKAIDLVALEAIPAPRVLLLERDDLPTREQWSQHMTTLGAEVSQRRVPGYVGMMDHPHATRVAQPFINGCVEFASGIPRADSAVPLAEPSPLREHITSRVEGKAVIEEATVSEAGQFAIHTFPADSQAGHGVLMLNVGANRHVGSNRTDVRLARQLAATGVHVLRIDLCGIGDSPARADSAENVVYARDALADVAAAVSALRARGARHVTASGMCSGGYHALYAAIAGQAIDAVCAVNCGVFGHEIKFDPQAGSLFNDITHYGQAMKSGSAWRRLLTGKVAFGTIARVAAWHLANRGKRMGREIARRLHIPLHHDLGSELLELAGRGVRVHFLYSTDEPGRIMLAARTGSVLPRLRKAGQLSMQLFEGPDHTFTQRWGQKRLHDALLALLTPRDDHGT